MGSSASVDSHIGVLRLNLEGLVKVLESLLGLLELHVHARLLDPALGAARPDGGALVEVGKRASGIRHDELESGAHVESGSPAFGGRNILLQSFVEEGEGVVEVLGVESVEGELEGAVALRRVGGESGMGFCKSEKVNSALLLDGPE